MQIIRGLSEPEDFDVFNSEIKLKNALSRIASAGAGFLEASGDRHPFRLKRLHRELKSAWSILAIASGDIVGRGIDNA
jgi:hypothetical protein